MKLEKHKTACGGYINISLRVQSHLAAHPEVIAYLREAIGKVHLPANGTKLECEVQMGRVIGRAGVVKTPPLEIHSPALFALRRNRKFPSRVTPLGAIGVESTTVVLIAKLSALPGEYDLITAWTGVLACKEPWDPNISTREEFEDCLRFWSTTALVFDEATMSPPMESSWSEVLTAAVPDRPLSLQDDRRTSPESRASSSVDAERLRFAILGSVLEEVGQTVDEVLREKNEKLKSEDIADFQRCSKLTDVLDRCGLRYVLAPPHLDCDGYLVLANPQDLLRCLPGLAPFNPGQHQHMTVGELPSAFWHAGLHAQSRVMPIKAGRQLRGILGGPVWAQESKRLRDSIRDLYVDELSCSVRQALEDLRTLAWPKSEDEQIRSYEIREQLESVGLMLYYERESPSEWTMRLAWPARLLRRHPRFQALHAEAWQLLAIE